MRNRTIPLLLAAMPLLLTPLACHSSSGGSSSSTVVQTDSGTSAAEFQTLDDYLSHPAVQDLLDRMPTHPGETPPDVTGAHQADGVVAFATDEALEGLEAFADFCFGTPMEGSLVVTILDSSVQDVGATSVVEGSGDLFTVYTAHRSVQTLESGSTCEIDEVNVFSGRLQADGSISELFVGLAIVDLLGTCDGLLLDDIQISEMAPSAIADGACPGTDDPVDVPNDPTNVLVTVENNLVVDLLVFLGDATDPILEIPALRVSSFETAPDFRLEFESLQPLAGTDADGNDLLMGEILAGVFPDDLTPAGESVVYVVESQIGDDSFFAPLPINSTDLDIFSVVNIGFDSTVLPGYPDPPLSGLDCLCIMPPSVDPFVIGYYSYSLPGLIDSTETKVDFFNVDDELEGVAAFDGPFAIDDISGTVVLRVE